MTRTLHRVGLLLILSILLAAILTGPALALEIKLGPVREQTIRWLMESRQLSRAAAEQEMRRAARENRADIIDSVKLPEGTIADFVTVDPRRPGKDKVQFQGCAMLFSPGSDYGRKFWEEVEKTKGTPAYDNFMAAWADAVERGFFIQKLTPEQVDRLKNAGTGRGPRATVTQWRVLIAAPIMPYWNDAAPSSSFPPHPHQVGTSNTVVGHPININWSVSDLMDYNNRLAEHGLSLGGPWSSGRPQGLSNPAWSNTGQYTDLPSGHPEIRRYYNTNTSLVEHWFSFFFDTSNQNSVANWWRANSHGNLQITGDRSNIAGWLEQMHVLDGTDIGESGSHDFLPFPGTPVIRPTSVIGTGYDIIRASLNGTNFSVLYANHRSQGGYAGSGSGSYTFRFGGWPLPAAGPLFNYDYWIKPGTGTMTIDPYDDRHVTFTGVTWQYNDPNKTTGNPTDASGGPPNGSSWVMNGPGGLTWDSSRTGYMPVGRGCATLSNTLVTAAEIITPLTPSFTPPSTTGPTRKHHFLKSFCYYTHDHMPGSESGGQRTIGSGQPYQLRHPTTNGYPDDIMGDTDSTSSTAGSEHYDRHIPYDHSSYDDANYPTGGYFHLPTAYNTGGHSEGGWWSDVNSVLTDQGWTPAGYNGIVYVFPAGENAPTGSHSFIPMGGGGCLTLPETSSLALAGHESGHAFAGLVDLYDTDFYWNGNRRQPPHLETDALGPYSIMANGGLRIDAWSKILAGFLSPVLLGTTSPRAAVDKQVATIPEIEGSLQSPIVYKALPDLWANPAITGDAEYFLIENRNRNGSAYFGDPSPRGLYIYHVDMRFGQDDDAHFMVAMEQADGLYQLETQSRGWNAGRPDAMAGDPFPGSYNIRSFNQLGTINGNGVKKSAPNTYSHGVVVSGTLRANTAYDTFFRADNISDPGANMTADLWVQPHELVVTGKAVAPAQAEQGATAVPVLGLHLKNTNTPPDISTGDVVIREILIDECGSSKNDSDTSRAVVYEDVDGDNLITPGTDVLLAAAPVQNQQANITGLSFRVAANSAERDLLLCYDIANSAEPGVTVGAGIDYADPNIDPVFPRSAITCQIPGVVQQRVRTGAAAPNNLGADRFPIRTDPSRTVIVEAPDTLTITPTSLAPATAIQGTKDVPMLGLRLRVNRDEVIVDGLKIDSMGTSTRPGDVSAKLYLDNNINGIIDPTDTVLDTATFSKVGGVPTAVFDHLNNYTVVEGTDRGLIVAYDFADDATGGATVDVRLLDTTYVTLRQTSPPPAAQDAVSNTNFLPPPTGMRSAPDTLIQTNTPPTLVDHLNTTVDWVIPQDGMPTTNFRWEATYTDAENQAPSFIRVVLDSVSRNMLPVNPGDTNYTDGALYRFQTTLPVGNHVYYITCSDGKTALRFPTTAPDTYPHPIVTNPAPTLTMVPGETDWWSPKQTTPPHDGTPRTTFTWRVIYTDVENEPPNPIEVWIDGTRYALTAANPADTDYTDGAEFTYATPLAVGLHSYYLYVSDGTNNVRIPSTAPNTLSGPDVYDPPCTLTDKNGGTTAWLTPTTGTPQTNFVWDAIYTDPESVPPAAIQVWIDGTGYNMVQVNPADTDYTDGALFRYQTTLPKGNHAYYMFADDGNNTVRFPDVGTYPDPVVTDQPCTLVDKSGGTTDWLTPQDGTPRTRFEWLATYTDPENQPPASITVVLDGRPRNMVQVNPADQDYTDGALFRFRILLPVGNHTYFMACSDGSNPLRYPASTTPPNNVYPHPVVTDPPCTLTDNKGTTTKWLKPVSGTPSTNFVWEAIYTDPESVAPVAIQVWIDSTAFDMVPVNPADQDYTDGALFRYQTTLPIGTHSYYMFADDGSNTVRFPATGAYPRPIVADQTPTLTMAPGETDWWSPKQTMPPHDGSPRTTFTWRAIYTDVENEPPSPIEVWIDGVAQAMTPVNPTDLDYTDGAEFTYATMLAVGTHSYYIFASDGTNDLRVPAAAPTTLNGPDVFDPLCTLTNVRGTTTNWVAPKTGNSKTVFVWKAVYTDPESVPPATLEVWLDGTAHAMVQVDPTDQDYTDGAVFRYETTLAVGNHSYYMRCSDGSNILRYPGTGAYPDPTVIDPVLALTDSQGGTTDWLTPTTGTPTTQFTWDAIYTDTKNNPPAPIQVWIDGVAHDLLPVNPSDTDYTDGALFRYQTTGLTVATHSYYMFASDGTDSVRFPPTPPATYPQPVVNNTPPRLLNAAVNPTAGTETTVFTYSITFRDADGHMPTYVRIKTDNGTWVDMVETNPADTNTIDGKTYQYQTGFIGIGPHTAVFTASDGFDTVIYPATGKFTGPVIITPSSAFWADSAYNPVTAPYEEGDKVYIQLTDLDQNVNVNARDTVDVTVTVVNGGDTETVTLRETDVSSGVFRTWPGGVSTLGRVGASGDGVINVIAGPTGNTLRLNYQDPSPFDPGDSLSLSAGVIDTRAPQLVALAELAATCDPEGMVVTVDWSAYDEASQIDVARYQVYFVSAPAPINTLTPVATPPAGTQTVQLPTGGPDGDMYVAVAVDDEVPNVKPDVKWRRVNTADRQPPSFLGENPANGSTEVALNTNISFRLDDGGSGIAEGDIHVRIQQSPADGGGWTDVTPSLVIGGTLASRTVSYDPPVDFLYNQFVTVEVKASDIAGNKMTATFSFSTATDLNAPQLQNAVPAGGAVNVPIDTDISFELTDDRSGVNPATIHVTVNGTSVDPALQIGGTPDLTTVLYNPPTDFSYGETVTVTVNASDVAGNAMSPVLYTFTILPDAVGAVIDQLSPADRTKLVPVDTDISFRVYDAISGVDKASVKLFIDGVDVGLTDANLKQLSPTSYLVTYQPPTAFPYSTTVRLRASAQDIAGNPRTNVNWSFTTEPPPTYSITGTIEETVTPAGGSPTKVGVSGVSVMIYQYDTGTGQLGPLVRTAVSVGTGVYEATGLLDGTYVVDPELTDYSFISRLKPHLPTHRVYVGAQDTNGDGVPEQDASGVDFDATHKLYAITGQVLEGGQGLIGVQVTDGVRTATTNRNGIYRITSVPSGTYTVTPTLTNYTFEPVSRTAVVASADATGVDFTATARTYTVSGTVQDAQGNRLVGVKVEVQGGTSVAVTSRAGQYTLTGVKMGQQTIVASRDGYAFEPAPGVTTVDLVVDRDLSGIDFIGYPLLSRTFAAGKYFIGVPATPRDTDPAHVFGTNDVARWVASLGKYVTPGTPPSDPGYGALAVAPGRGYFVKYLAETQINFAGTPVPATDPYIFVIDDGWTMAANPFPSAIPFANLVPNAANTMAPYGFVYQDGRYQIVSNVTALGGRPYIDGWEGIWLLGDVAGASITAMPPGSRTSAVADQPARVVNARNWRIPIVARAAGTIDDCAAVGVSAVSGPLAVPNPPPLPNTVDVILHGAKGQPLAYDFKDKLGVEATWQFSVATSVPNTQVEVVLPDLSEVPQNLNVTLVDVAAGKRIYARTTPSYVYSSGQGGAREFRLEVQPRKTAGLSLRTAGAQVRANLAAVTYVLSADAEISARVINLGGRPIRTLAQGKAVAAGTNALNWNLLSDAQTRVPNGPYVIQIEAVSPDGQRVNVVQSILVNR